MVSENMIGFPPDENLDFSHASFIILITLNMPYLSFLIAYNLQEIVDHTVVFTIVSIYRLQHMLDA